MRWLSVASVVFVTACTPTDPLPMADRIAAEIKSNGAGPVVRRLWESGEYNHVLDGIAAGDGALIALSPALAAGADAGASEGLGDALAHALPRNAAAVLSALDPGRPAISPARVCGIPFIEGGIADVAAYRREAQTAIARVDRASPQNVKVACLAALQ